MAQTPEAMVGIFWWYQGRLVIEATAVSQAEPYGENLTHDRGHLEYWSAQQEARAIPLEVEYEEVPRGRVVYQPKQNHFTFYADRCILRQTEVVAAIMAQLNLPADRTSFSEDSHYRCPECPKAIRLPVAPLNWEE